MARLTRLCVPGAVHVVMQRGHGQQPVFVDDVDRHAYLDALRVAADAHGVAVHAFALLHDEVWWIATPSSTDSLGRTVQAVGQRFVSGFNRRHGLRGTRWDGRFRSAAIDAEMHGGAAVVLIHQWAQAVGQGAQASPAIQADSGAAPWSSAPHFLGHQRLTWLHDLAWYWGLGNTPFEREHAFARALATLPDLGFSNALSNAVHRGWALGPPSFTAKISEHHARRVTPMPRGRPKK